MRSSLLTMLGLFLLAFGAAGCGPSPTEPSHFAPFSQTDLRVGTGAAATPGDELTVHYTLWLYHATGPDNKGAMVETSIGQEPFSFVLGAGATIAGWEQGLPGMQTGGARRLIVPPSLAYGPARSQILPPNATLLFEIELLEIETP